MIIWWHPYDWLITSRQWQDDWTDTDYHKVAISSMSLLVAHLMIFRRLMKGKFDACVVWPLAKKFQNWIVDRSTARDFTVYSLNSTKCHQNKTKWQDQTATRQKQCAYHTGRNCFNLFQNSFSSNTADAHPGVSGVSKGQKFFEKFKITHCQVNHPAKIE